MPPASPFRAIVAGSIGNLVEWFDWYAYSAFALYFAPVFFPQASPTAQLLSAAAIFAVGFLMRPLVVTLLVVSAYTSISAIVKAELFPTHVRAVGVGLPYALTTAIFGGTAEYLALLAKERGHAEWFYYYVAGCAFLSLLVYWRMGETRSRGHL